MSLYRRDDSIFVLSRFQTGTALWYGMDTQVSTRSPALSAVILSGGKSSRMGRPKALLPFDDKPLIAHLVQRLSQRFSDIVVVAAPDQSLPSLPVTLVRDAVAYQGPVGGLYYGLRAIRGAAAFVTSCDVPFLQLPFIDYLVSQLAHNGRDYDVVVPVWQDRLQPLHAVYRQRVVPHLQEQLATQRLRPVYLYDTVPTRKVSPTEIKRFDPEGLSFLNMNTQADYQAALARWRTLSAPISCTVELFGVARLTARTSRVPLTLSAEATLADALAVLGAECPALLGSVLSADEAGRTGLRSGYTCNINGKDFVRDAHTRLRAGDSLLILSSDAGG